MPLQFHTCACVLLGLNLDSPRHSVDCRNLRLATSVCVVLHTHEHFRLPFIYEFPWPPIAQLVFSIFSLDTSYTLLAVCPCNSSNRLASNTTEPALFTRRHPSQLVSRSQTEPANPLIVLLVHCCKWLSLSRSSKAWSIYSFASQLNHV